MSQLWFDVESRYETTKVRFIGNADRLWFDVESRYETTLINLAITVFVLWFDVESRYETTYQSFHQQRQQVVV